MDVVYLIEGIIIVTIAVYFQISFFGMLDLSFDFQAAYGNFLSISSKLQNPSLSDSEKSSLNTQFIIAENDAISTWVAMQEEYGKFLSIGLLFTMYFVKNLCQILFAKLRKKYIPIITPETIINFISCFVAIYSFWMWKFYYLQLSAPIPKYWALYVADKAFNDPLIKGVFGAGLYIGLQWWRVFFILQLSRVFGPLIEIVLSMLKELFKFITIYGLIFMIFLSTGSWMYYNYSDFKSQNWRGMIYLFSASLGNFDFSLFSQNEEYLPRQYGWIYLILFLVLTNIVLINFLIAILSNKYTEMEPKKKLLYNRNILRIKQIQAEDKYYSCLISSFVPLNFMMLPFVPFIVIFKSEKLNHILMYAWYVPMVAIGTIFFVVGSLALLPFAYLVSIYSSAVSMYKVLKANKITFKLVAVETGWLVLVVLLSVLYLLAQTVADTVVFVVTLFDENTKSKQDSDKSRTQLTDIDPEVFDVLVDIVEHGGDKINVKDVILYFRHKFRLVDQIAALLFNSRVEPFESSKDDEEVKFGAEGREQQADTYRFGTLNHNFDEKVILVITVA